MLRPPQGSVGGHDVMLAAVSPLGSSTGMPAPKSVDLIAMLMGLSDLRPGS